MLDVRTMIVSYLVTSMVAVVFVGLIWRQYRHRYGGIFLFLVGSLLNVIGPFLLLLRDVIPDLASIVLANVLTAGGLLAAFYGIERFAGLRGRMAHNAILVGILIVGLMYFTFIQPDINMRVILVSAVLATIAAQAASLTFRGVSPLLRPALAPAGVLFCLYTLTSVWRIATTIMDPMSPRADLFSPAAGVAVNGLYYQLVAIAFPIVLMLAVFTRLGSEVLASHTESEAARVALMESERRFRALVLQAGDGFELIGPDGAYLDIDEATCRMTGYSREELLRMGVPDLDPFKDQATFASEFRSLRSDSPITFETVHRRKDGSTFPVEVAATLVPAGNGVAALTLVRDITGRKRADDARREAERLYETVFRLSPELMVLTSEAEGRYLAVSDSHERVTGWAPSEVIGYTAAEFDPWNSPGDRQGMVQRLREEGNLHNVEVVFHRKSGEPYTALISSARVDVAGEACLLSIVTDISDRKRSEEALRVSEERYRQLVENATEAILVAQDGMLKFANQNASVMAGYSVQEFTSRPFPEFIHPDDRAMVVERYLMRLKGDSPEARYSFRLITRDGTVRWVELGAVLIAWQGRPATLNFLTDITERKRADEALRESERHLRSVIKAAPVALWDLDTAGTILLSEGNALARLGLEAGELVGRSVFEFNKDDPQALALIRRGLEGEEFSAEVQVGGRHWSNHYVPRFDEKGRVVGLVGVSVDDTERKHAEEALRESEAIFTSFLEHSPVYVFFKDEQIRALRLSSNFDQLLGMPVADALGKTMDDLFPSDLAKAMVADDQRILTQGERVDVVEELNGRTYETTKFPILKDGKPVMLAGFTVDVTARKRAEQLLKESEEKYRQLIELTPNGVLIHVRGKIVFANPAAARIVGAAIPEDLTGERLLDFVHPDYREVAAARIKAAQPGIMAPMIEYKLVRKDGTVMDAEVVGIGTTYNGEDAVQVVFRDITDRKRAERQLVESERQLREAQEMAGMGNWTLDPVTMEVQASDQLLRLYGLPPGSKPLQDAFAAMHPDDRESSREQINLCLRTGKPYNMEYRVVMEDGSVRWLNGIGLAERDADGRIVRLVGATQDITARKLIEERIRAALNEKETLLRELYHRTKNNMQVIASLLDLQAGQVADERLTAAFTATKSRIYSMALVHQKLYEAKDLSRVNLREYIDDLVRLLMRTYRMSSAPLTYVQEMEDVFVLVDSAIPCGLIVNELISNALKHAFPSGKSGELRVRLWRTGEGEVCLEVADNGVGLPPGFDFRRDGRLGLQNILALGEDQLEGTVELETSAGVALRLRFKDDLYHPRV